MNDAPDIGFAIIGTGSIADTHAAALKEAAGARLRAVYNRSFDKAEAFARREGVDAEKDLDALLRRDDIQAVCVTTPSGAHGEVAIRALDAGKHVLCEKPLEITVERVDSIIEAAERNHRILAAVFQARFGTGIRYLKTAIEQGRFGRLTLCSTYIKWWRTQEYYDEVGWRGTWKLDGGGALMNQSIHTVDLLQWLVGLPSEVSAFSDTLAHEGIEAEDTLTANLRWPEGAIGSIEAATSVYPGFARRIEISGENGTAILEDDRILAWEFRDKRPEDAGIRAGKGATDIKGGSSDPKATGTTGHRLQIEDLAGAIRENRPPAIPGRDARNAIQLITSIYRSIQEKQPVSL